MKKVQIVVSSVAALSLVVGLGCATPEGLKPTQAWDQAAATNLAGELVSRVASASAIANTKTVDVDLMENVYDYITNLGILERQSRELHGDLQAGKGYSETLWLYGEARHTFQTINNSPSWHMISEKLAASGAAIAEVMNQLDDYYGNP
jgi:hypothetical protein